MSNTRTIDYGVASVREFRPIYTATDDGQKLTAIEIDGQSVEPTKRFWTSLICAFSSYGLTQKLWKLFSHEEVLQRVHERVGEADSRLRWAIETTPTGARKLLGLSRPNKALMQYQPTYELMNRYAVAVGENSGQLSGRQNAVSYNEGIIVAEHQPQFVENFRVGADTFAPRYVTETPVDGFGEPITYLSLMRQICTNGAIGYAAAFRSRVNLGKDNTDSIATMARMLDAFNNEEGYSALRQRFESSTGSWASIRECEKAYLAIASVADAGGLRESTYSGTVSSMATQRQIARRVGAPADVRDRINRAYLQLTGDIMDRYRITTVDTLSEKKQAQLPARCTVYDLLNFVTEIATHWVNSGDAGVAPARKLQAYVGELISNEYDLEGSQVAKPNYQDWFTDIREANVDDVAN